MRWWPLLLCAALAACSSSSSPPADAGLSDATADAGDGAAACGVAKCNAPSDCALARGGQSGCWQCIAGCCTAVPAGTDPASACVTACKTAMCDGNGGCGAAVSTVAKGTVCGNVCYVNTSNQALVVAAECDGSGVCTQFAGMQTDCYATAQPSCVGNSNNCTACPASGCAAHCADPDAAAPSCP